MPNVKFTQTPLIKQAGRTLPKPQFSGFFANTVRIRKTGKACTPGLAKPVCLIHQIKKPLQFYKIPEYNQALCWPAATVERFKSRKS